MTEQELKDRTKNLALQVIEYVEALPNSRVTDVLGKQLLRSGTSVAANYRSACRARSDAEMAAKLGIAEEEADESQLWVELLDEKGFAAKADSAHLWQELDELVAILVASRRTVRRRVATRGNTQR